MSVIIDIDHETGDLSQYTNTATDLGDLSVVDSAALAGTSYGLSVFIDGTGVIYGEYALVSEDTSGSLRMRFYIDPNSLSMADTNEFAFLYVYNNSSGLILVAVINYTTLNGYRLRCATYDDGGTGRYLSYVTLDDAPHYIEILLTRAATIDSNDGVLTMWTDGTLSYTRSDLDNNGRFANFKSLMIGAVGGIDAGTSGAFYLDELVVNNDGGEIGPVSAGGPTLSVNVTPEDQNYWVTGLKVT